LFVERNGKVHMHLISQTSKVMVKNTQIGLGEMMKGTMGEDGDNQKVRDHLEILKEIMMIRLKEQVTKP
jgi:hypothetical protein